MMDVAGSRRRLGLHLTALLASVLGLAMIVMEIAGLMGIADRNFGWGLRFIQELATGLFLWISFVGVGPALQEGTHVQMSLVVSKLPPRVRRYTEMLNLLLWTAFGGVLVYWGGKLVLQGIRLGQTTAGMGVPSAAFELAMPVGGAVLMVASVARIIDISTGSEEYAESSPKKGATV